ncbi:MAG: hypothetical protein IIC73_06155, partial [Armatimonadetes bacterium]|nr:hypothetical protein [Armatimonadota bacterium]
MRRRILVRLLLGVAATVAATQDKPSKLAPEQFIIKINVIEHLDSLVLPTASLARDGISIYRGEEKAELLKRRVSVNWGKTVSAPMVRTLTGFPAIVSTTNSKHPDLIRSVVFIDDQSLLLSLGFFSGQRDIKDLKASDFDLHTTYFNPGDVLLFRRDSHTFVIVEITQVKADDYGIPPLG